MLSRLCKEWQAAKAEEISARDKRIKIEDRLLLLVPYKLEGTETTTQDGYKIAVTTKLSRKLDIDAYRALDLPDNLAFVTYRPELDLKRLRAVEMVDPVLVALCVTSFPAKASMKIEEVI